MKQFRQHLTNSFFAALIAIPLGSLIVGLVLGIGLAFIDISSNAAPAMFGIGLLIALMGAILSILPTLLYGVVVHASLAYKGFANYGTMILFGAAPGVAVAVVDPGSGFWWVAFGVPIALLTHRFAKRRLPSPFAEVNT